MTTRFHRATPILRVRRLADSIEHYVRVLRFGSDPRSDRPAGDWLDMYGERWGPPA